MAAVTGNAEQVETGDELSGGVFSGFGEAEKAKRAHVLSAARDPRSMHSALARTHWVRNAVEHFLQRVRFRHEWDGSELALRITESPFKRGNTPIVPNNIVSFARGGSDVSKVQVWSEGNSKMDCPSYDVPSGGTAIGGTCPGANPGQSIISGPARRDVLPPAPGTSEPVRVNQPLTICNACYAESGSYAYADNQVRNVLRYWWTSAMVSKHYDDWVRLMCASVVRLRFPAGTPGNILPVRLHSSGDFFNQVYASAWMEVADRLASGDETERRIRFWAPTRTWAVPGWQEFWARELPKLRGDNFTVRASAYHFDDPAPGKLAPNNAMGSTSIYATPEEVQQKRTDFRARGDERARFDWQCPTYAAGTSETKNCSSSPNPMGGTHCRACWVLPDARINYAAH